MALRLTNQSQFTLSLSLTKLKYNINDDLISLNYVIIILHEILCLVLNGKIALCPKII